VQGMAIFVLNFLKKLKIFFNQQVNTVEEFLFIFSNLKVFTPLLFCTFSPLEIRKK
jgi:hypothetical protein